MSKRYYSVIRHYSRDPLGAFIRHGVRTCMSGVVHDKESIYVFEILGELCDFLLQLPIRFLGWDHPGLGFIVVELSERRVEFLDFLSDTEIILCPIEQQDPDGFVLATMPARPRFSGRGQESVSQV